MSRNCLTAKLMLLFLIFVQVSCSAEKELPGEGEPNLDGGSSDINGAWNGIINTKSETKLTFEPVTLSLTFQAESKFLLSMKNSQQLTHNIEGVYSTYPGDKLALQVKKSSLNEFMKPNQNYIFKLLREENKLLLEGNSFDFLLTRGELVDDKDDKSKLPLFVNNWFCEDKLLNQWTLQINSADQSLMALVESKITKGRGLFIRGAVEKAATEMDYNIGLELKADAIYVGSGTLKLFNDSSLELRLAQKPEQEPKLTLFNQIFRCSAVPK
ncbi:MAG: hypothetical protein KBD78_07890 [Oligoflexales bacterium]|nr:hypothetical protein [Oligoflexales bacterium]